MMLFVSGCARQQGRYATRLTGGGRSGAWIGYDNGPANQSVRDRRQHWRRVAGCHVMAGAEPA